MNYPMGNPFGPAHEPEVQRHVLRTALNLVKKITVPGEIVDYDATWPADFTDKVTKSLLAMS